MLKLVFEGLFSVCAKHSHMPWGILEKEEIQK